MKRSNRRGLSAVRDGLASAAAELEVRARAILSMTALLLCVVGSGGTYALTFTHNGTIDDPGVVGGAFVFVPGTGDVNVAVYSFIIDTICGPLSNTETCDPFKIWLPGSTEQTHTTTFSDVTEPFFLLLDLVGNGSGVNWTDYHFQLTGATFSACVESGSAPGVQPFQCDGSSAVNLIFDSPFPPFDFLHPDPIASPEVLFFAATITPDNGVTTITLDQHPSIPEPATLALLGIGLAGLGFARRQCKQ